MIIQQDLKEGNVVYTKDPKLDYYPAYFYITKIIEDTITTKTIYAPKINKIPGTVSVTSVAVFVKNCNDLGYALLPERFSSFEEALKTLGYSIIVEILNIKAKFEL
jgi:hypothetical protein